MSIIVGMWLKKVNSRIDFLDAHPWSLKKRRNRNAGNGLGNREGPIPTSGAALTFSSVLTSSMIPTTRAGSRC
jgi:hypothetical protein